MALPDALTQSYGIPLYIFGGASTSIETDMSIDGDSEHGYALAKMWWFRALTALR
jgi:hypothetical protein